jgi:rod shape-determining protein MreD
MSAAARAQEILLPVTTGLIAITIVIALVANLIPLPLQAHALRPDFCALVLLYWGIHQPRRVGFTIAFALGLVIDLADASLFGQHALAYTALLFAAIGLHRRVLNFSAFGQALHVFPLLLGAELIAVAVRLVAGDELPAAAHFLGPVIGAVLWIPLCVVLRLPRLPKAHPEL